MASEGQTPYVGSGTHPNAKLYGNQYAPSGVAGPVGRIDPGEPVVYWGLRPPNKVQPGTPANIGGVPVDEATRRGIAGPPVPATGTRYPTTLNGNDIRGLSESKADVRSWSDETLDKWSKHLVNIGFLEQDEADNPLVLYEALDLILETSTDFASGPRRMTPWQVAEMLVRSGEAGRGGRGAGGFTGSRSSRSTSVDLTDPHTAKAIINDALSNYLGRAATDEEINTFRGVINQAERANPTVTDSTTSYADGVATSQSSTTSGGMTNAGRQQMIADDVMQKPEYGAYQAAAEYFPLLQQAIGATAAV